MDKFKPNKSKAFGVAVIQVANEKAGEVIQQLAATHPKLAMTLTYVQASFGVLLAYKQEKLNQFTEYLIEHPDVYTEEKLQTKEFQDGLPVWLDSYFKLRSAEKLKLAQNTFLDFSRTPNMPLYPLERYDDLSKKSLMPACSSWALYILRYQKSSSNMLKIVCIRTADK